MSKLFESLWPSFSDFLPSTDSTNPLYDIYVNKGDETKLTLVFSLPGYGLDDLDVYTHEQKLVVKGKRPKTFAGYSRALVPESFGISIPIGEFEILDASLVNGVLMIELGLIIPEEKKPKKVEVRAL